MYFAKLISKFFLTTVVLFGFIGCSQETISMTKSEYDAKFNPPIAKKNTKSTTSTTIEKKAFINNPIKKETEALPLPTKIKTNTTTQKHLQHTINYPKDFISKINVISHNISNNIKNKKLVFTAYQFLTKTYGMPKYKGKLDVIIYDKPIKNPTAIIPQRKCTSF
jgi:hypothetical protein